MVYVTIGNPAFCLFLYLTGVHFWGELQHGGDISQQKIKCRSVRTREIGGVSSSDVLHACSWEKLPGFLPGPVEFLVKCFTIIILWWWLIGWRERFSPNESERYGSKLLYDWLKHENRQYMSKMTSKLPILGGEKLSFLSSRLRLSLSFRLRF